MDGDGEAQSVSNMLRARSGRLAGVVAMVAIVAPLLWVATTRDERFTGDLAIIELRVRDVLSAHPPIAGAYSRYGWAHPGPWQFYLFALPYRLLGGDARAIQLTTLAFNVAVAVAIVKLAARRDRATAIVTGVALLVLVVGLRPQSMAYGWNVTVVVLPFVLVAIGCWRLLDGDRWALPITTLATLFVCQAHVGAGVVVVPLAVVALTIAALRSLRGDAATPDAGDRRAWRSTLIVAGIAAIPPGYDVVTDPPGNIGRILRWSLNNDEPTVGTTQALRMIGRSSSLSFLRDPQLPGRFLLELGEVDPGLLPGLSIGLLFAALVVAHRHGWASERSWCSIVMLLWAVGLVAASSITEPLGWWLVQWLQPLGWLTWVAVVLVAWRFVADRVRGPHRSAVTAWSLALATIVGAVAIVDHGRDAIAWPDPEAEFTRPVDELTAAIRRELEAGSDVTDGPIARIDFGGESLLAETMLSGVVDRLAALDVDVCVDARLAYKLGEHRVCPAGITPTLLLRSEPRTTPTPADGEIIADVDPLLPAERAEADAIAARAADVLVRNGRADEVTILDSPLADVVLLDDPPAELVAMSAGIERLAALRKVPGDRYVLYVIR